MLQAQQDLQKNLLENKSENRQTPKGGRPGTARNNEAQKASMLAKFVTKTAVLNIEKEKQDREIYIEPTRWNKIKLFFINCYEALLIILGLALSIYQDDIISFFFQIVMQTLLYFAMRDMGANIWKQKKISLGLLVATILTWVIKYVVILRMEPTLAQDIGEYETLLYTFGFNWMTQEDGKMVFKLYESLEFETLALILNILLMMYYNGQIQREVNEGKFHYIHHSEWLTMDSLLYRLFFIFIIADTLFSQTIVQMVILGFMLTLFLLWAVDLNKKTFEKVTEYAILWIRRIYTLQIFMIAFSQIAYVMNYYKENPSLYDGLFISGLILNEIPGYAAVTHIMLICFVLGFGQLFEATFFNHKDYKDNIGLYQHHNLQEKLLHNQGSARRDDDDGTRKGSLYNNITDYDYEKFMVTYKPYLCLWGARGCALILCYGYHGYPALISLAWLLLSFVINLYPFVIFTIFAYMPVYIFSMLFQYFVNIQGIFYKRLPEDQIEVYRPSLFVSSGRMFRFPAIEAGLMVIFAFFLIALMKWKNELKAQRDELRIGLFSRLTDYRSNFLFQLFFYVLKRIHIPILSLIFVYGMRELNIYYIGLMYFFVVYVSSLVTYRKSGRVLILYAGLFIWVQYLWSLVQTKFDQNGNIYKLFTMITLQKYVPKDDIQIASQLNQYLEYKIPIEQWTIFFLQVFMVSINNLFVSDKTYKQKSIENPSVNKEYNSIAEYYEEKNDFVLRKKFPGTARVLIRLTMIFSEMTIIAILITQGFILVQQSPNIMFWGFLIFSLTLQTAVVSANQEDPNVLRKCARQSLLLRIYSGFVLIAQIGYHFINDKSFLAQYGFDKLLNGIIGPLQTYMPIIGFENYANSTRSLFEIFISQILFYITACYLEDYFYEQYDQAIQRQDRIRGERNGQYEVLGEPAENGLEPPTPQGQSLRAPSMLFRKKIEDEEFLQQSDHERVTYDFERVRFSIPYMIYQRMGSWRFIDSVTMNFYIVSSTVTVVLCTNWQISLFMAFYLLCNVILCIRAAASLHRNSKNMKNSQKKEVSLDDAHQMNKDYMYAANKTLLKVRTSQWTYQYWLLILSMIIMYPTPIVAQLKMSEAHQHSKENFVFWLFWSGLYTSPKQLESIWSAAPLYAMLILLIFEKQAQRWQTNRYGCTLDKITQFRKLEEEMKLVQKGEAPVPKQMTSKIPEVNLREENGEPTQYVTIMEARQECSRIKSLYREQTPQVKEKRLKRILQLELKRKYTIKMRSALKVLMEQLSLFLLLCSCANKSNIISVLYLGLLLTFLVIKNKTTGMLIMSYVFGLTLATEYLVTLTNFTSISNPHAFPAPFDKGYPTIDPNTGAFVNQFVFPWFVKVDFLRDHLEWAHFLSIDIQSSQVNDIWFDFANLIVLTIYFFNYGNPINAQNIKVSFSSSVVLEDCLNRYAKMRMKKKYYLKKGKKENEIKYDDVEEEEDRKNYFPKKGEQPKETNLDQSFSSEKAADDSMEHFMGATFYLAELKSELFIYSFLRRMRYFTFIGLQVITLTMTFLLAFLCRSLMSLGYMILCVPLILQITDFFRLEKLQEQGKRWKHPYFISGPLMIFSFIDIALQIFCQSPFYEGNYFQKQLGFEKVYEVRNMSLQDLMYPTEGSNQAPFVQLAENGRPLAFLILKSINLFHIFLQSRVYESESFYNFIRIDLRRLISLANSYKKFSVTFRYNNWKLQKIVSLQQKKRKMYESLAELRIKMNHWQKTQKSLISGELVKNIRQPLLSKIDETDEEHKDQTTTSQINTSTAPQETPQASSIAASGMGNEVMDRLMKRISAKKSMIGEQLKMGNLKDFLNADDDWLDKKKELKKQKTKLGRCGSFYIYLKKHYVNQIAFIDDLEDAQNVKQDMEKGKRKIMCELEKVMMQDINLYFTLRKKKTHRAFGMRSRNKLAVKDGSEDLQLEDMKKTQEFLKLGHITVAVIGTLFEAIFSNMATVSYIMMIYSMMQNAGIISVVFPFAIFGFALLEEGRPGKQFWSGMLIYALVIIFLKFIINLDIVNDQREMMTTYMSIQQWMLVGLWRVEGIAALLAYILPEIMIMITIIGQIYYEHLIGLYEKREIDVENIQEARERFLNSFSEVDKLRQIQLRKEQQRMKLLEDQEEEENLNKIIQEDFDKFILTIGKDFKAIKETSKEQRLPKEAEDLYPKQLVDQRTDLVNEIVEFLPPGLMRRQSFIVDKAELKRKSKECKKRRKTRENQGIVNSYFKKVPFFRRLFPKIKEQKPGVDFYGKITLIQFVICIYLIQYYTEMDARGTQNLENSNLFSFYMVIMLFIQVFVMILERYISRTNIMVNVKKAGSQKKEEVETDDKLMQNMPLTDTLKSLTMHLQSQKTSETMLFDKEQKGIDKTTQDILKIELQHTRMTPQQVTKFTIQWILLILYHALVFWIFPLSSNDAIYGTPYCDTNSSQYVNYGCFSFSQNWYLIIFYLIFCIYFMLSALQIRYGLPDFKEPSSLTVDLSAGAVIRYRIFYVLPFLLELKVILDWCWSKTSLDLFQWLELAEIDTELYFFKSGNVGYFKRKLGQKIYRFEKCLCGCFCLGAILFFLIGPFLMFSNLRYIAQNNLVENAQIDFSVSIDDLTQMNSYKFPIFSTDNPLNIRTLDEGEFETRGYHVLPETKFFEPNQVQMISMKDAADSQWPVSGDYRGQFEQFLDLAVSQAPGILVNLQLSYKFQRPGPVAAPVAFGQTNITLDFFDAGDHQILTDLYQAMQMNCTEDESQTHQIRIQEFIPYQLRLGERKNVIEIPLAKENVTLEYSCENYWSFRVNDEGVTLITFSDLISGDFFSASSIMAFYLGVAFTVGSILRSIVVYKADRIFICDIPDPEPVRNLIRCIFLQRLEQNLKKEEELFFILMEILRSPEMLKAICGSSLRAPLVATQENQGQN